MYNFFAKLLDTSDFPPRWLCGNWSDFLGWLHVVSDLATFAAYYTIPLVLVYFVRKRRDLPFSKLFWLFAAFILACGTVHLIEAIIFWHPIYRVSGLVKLMTACVSWAAVVALVRVVPSVMHYPALAITNETLERQVQQHRQIEAELHAIKGRYEALLRGTRSIVWTTTTDGQFVTPQLSWQRYTGQDWEQHKGMGWLDAVHQEDRSELMRRWERATEKNTKYSSTGRIWHQASHTYRSFVAEAVPVTDANGEVVEWVGTVSDIEEQQQAEVALNIAQADLLEQKRELELIYEAAPVGMSLVDRELKYLRINSRLAEINGYPVAYHLGRRVDEVLPGLWQQKLKAVYSEVFEAGQPKLDIEIEGMTPANKKKKTWLASFYPVEIHADPVGGVSAIVQDITDRKQQEARLRKSEQAALAANRSKSEFLANMSHEIRTPMSAILGYADLLLSYLQDPDNRNCVQIIKKNGDYLLQLINDILDLSRIEANKMEVEIQPTNLLRLVADVHSLMQVRASEKQLELEARFDTSVPETISTDPIRLRQVLINLCGNAIKFTEKGTITLAVSYVENDPSVVTFRVIDTGIGISQEQQERLFKPFSQGDTSVTRQYGGSGLGLAISQRLVQMMGGEVTAESEPEKGSTFTVRMPVPQRDEVPMIQPILGDEEGQLVEVNREPRKLDCRVLVVDDRREVRYITQHFLEKAGATVASAEDGVQGIDAVMAAKDERQPFDLVLMDMQMPNVDGLQATSKLRCSGIETPIIALTADAMKGDREKCLDGGCDDYLPKPIDQADLIEIVGRYTQDFSPEQLRIRRSERAKAPEARLRDDDES